MRWIRTEVRRGIGFQRGNVPALSSISCSPRLFNERTCFLPPNYAFARLEGRESSENPLSSTAAWPLPSTTRPPHDPFSILLLTPRGPGFSLERLKYLARPFLRNRKVASPPRSDRRLCAVLGCGWTVIAAAFLRVIGGNSRAETTGPA